jgi:anti-anti-sigma regulatory factor
MFRITKAYENDSTEIFRIEGQVTDDALQEWIHAIALLQPTDSKAVILDFAQVWFMSTKAVEALIRVLDDRSYVMNCGMELRNVLHVSGLSEKML